MAQAPQTPSRPPPLTRGQMDNPNAAREVTREGNGNGPPKLSQRETFKQRMEEQAAAFKRTDDAAYERATMGVGDDEDLRDKLLALGCDVTRASPAREQPLPDAVPGLTTTTGAHGSPIDPTTAAVPAPDDSEMVVRRRGFPTVGSGREGGGPEKRWMKRQSQDAVAAEE
jgi:hypothetical protein